MKKDVSLAKLIRDDPSLVKRIQKITEDVKKDNTKIKAMSQSYNERYNKEILAGTAKKSLLLEDGKRHGKTAEEVERNSGFIPTIYTPILNWLWFFIREEQNQGRELLREEQDETFRTLLHEMKEIEAIEKAPDMLTYIYGNMTLESFQTLKKLKRLSKSPEEREAFQAYRKCLELCKKFNIEFDRIPD